MRCSVSRECTRSIRNDRVEGTWWNENTKFRKVWRIKRSAEEQATIQLSDWEATEDAFRVIIAANFAVCLWPRA